MDIFDSNTDSVRYCAGATVLMNGCNADISDLHGNAIYCAKCSVGIKKLRLENYHKNLKHEKRVKARAEIDRKFKVYHQSNPEKYDRLVGDARIFKDSGVEEISVRYLADGLRCDGITIPNNYLRCYRELIEQNEPDLRGLFTGGEK